MPLFLEQRLKKKHPESSVVFVENRANGAAAISTLERQIRGINKVSPSKSKYDRAFASSDELNANNWYLPHPQPAPWVDAFLFELSAFPREPHPRQRAAHQFLFRSLVVLVRLALGGNNEPVIILATWKRARRSDGAHSFDDVAFFDPLHGVAPLP